MEKEQCRIVLLEARARELLMCGEARAEAKASANSAIEVAGIRPETG